MDLGQHFLVDKSIVDKIVNSLELNSEDVVLEIGGGKGTLTENIVEKVKRLYVIEIDEKLVNLLKNKFVKYNNIEIIKGNFLDFDFKKFFDKKIKIVGNVPYSITSDILEKIFLSIDIWCLCVLMLQKEVVQKLIAKPKETFFSKLTLTANFYTEIKFVCDVEKEKFSPQPKVNSAVVKFSPKEDFLSFKYKENFFKIIDIAFKCKRKTLLNSLSLGLKINKEKIKKILVNSDVNFKQRPHETSLEQYLKITEKLSKFID
ncbi:MAG: 16S rRNA (adenine(1518)-N(6)/adenine(1519)-N(6))-dimethyltransferase RsmA [Endomicrobiia bacterium]